MNDKIYIRNIRADILIGINPEERINKQPVVVNATLFTNCSKASDSDDIKDAVDYSVIHDEIVSHLHNTHYDLIETLAVKISEICLSEKAVKECIVCIDKPEALEYADSVAVEVYRTQND